MINIFNSINCAYTQSNFMPTSSLILSIHFPIYIPTLYVVRNVVPLNLASQQIPCGYCWISPIAMMIINFLEKLLQGYPYSNYFQKIKLYNSSHSLSKKYCYNHTHKLQKLVTFTYDSDLLDVFALFCCRKLIISIIQRNVDNKFD